MAMKAMILCIILSQMWGVGEEPKLRNVISLLLAVVAWILCMFVVPWA